MTIVKHEIVEYSVCVSLTPTSIRMCFISKICICLHCIHLIALTWYFRNNCKKTRNKPVKRTNYVTTMNINSLKKYIVTDVVYYPTFIIHVIYIRQRFGITSTLVFPLVNSALIGLQIIK